MQRIQGFIAIAFFLSTAFTAAFIARYHHYQSAQIMALSGSIAGAKWAIQILLGLFMLKEKRWLYLSQLAATCLTGSIVLLPFVFSQGSSGFFFGSLVASVLIMTIDLYRRLKLIRLPIRWYFLWLALLAVAVLLQLTVVFHVF